MRKFIGMLFIALIGSIGLAVCTLQFDTLIVTVGVAETCIMIAMAALMMTVGFGSMIEEIL